MWRTSTKFRVIIRQCLTCGQDFRLHNNRDVNRKKYCSNECRLRGLQSSENRKERSLSQTGKPHPHKRNKGRFLSKTTKAKISIALQGREFSSEHRKNLSKALRGRACMVGSNHPAWKGGVKPWHRAIQNLAVYKEWRLGVYERDNFTCIACGQVGGELHAHHIFAPRNNPELAFELSNGATLCKRCHSILHKRGKKQKGA